MGWNHDPDAFHHHQSGEINALTEKTTPADDDLLVVEDSADSNKKKKVKVANLGGGAKTLDDLTDVDTTGVADGDVLVYDSDTSTWVPGEGGGTGSGLRGTATIEDSETEVTVNHGLPRTPEAGEIQLVPEADEDGWLDGAASTKYGIKDLTSATFDIEVDQAPGSGKHVTFDWLWVPASLAVLPGYVQAVLDDNPLAYFRLGESEAGPIIDQMGGSPGSVTGTLTYGVPGAIAGDPDTAIQLPSVTTSYIDLPVAPNYQTGGGFALEFWIALWSSGSRSIPIRDLVSSGGNYPLFDNSGTINYSVGGSAFNTGIASSGYLGLSTFTHVVMEYVHSGPTVNLYLDGSLAHTSSTSSKSGTWNTGIRLFRSGTSSNSSPCILDEVAVYQHPLGATQVGVHYAAAQ